MTARFSSAAAYIQDAFLISFILLFVDTNADWPLVLIWMCMVLAAAVTAAAVSWRKPYQPIPVLVAALLIMTFSFFAGITIGTFLVLSILSLYRLHARFSEIEDQYSGESFFLILFLIIFTISLILSLFNPMGNSGTLLFPLTASAIAFYTIARLHYRYLVSRREGAKWQEAFAVSFGLIAMSGMAAGLVYFIAEEARQLAGTLFGGILAIVLWPLAGALNWLVSLINGLSSETEKMDNLSELGEQANQPDEIPYSAGMEFDYTIVVTAGIAIAVVIGILLIWKIKPELADQDERTVAEIERYSKTAEKEEEAAPEKKDDFSDVHEIRKAFREFEEKATLAERGRLESETIREWARREQLPFTERFFKTYDRVRYSDEKIANSEAFPFIEELKKINEKNLKENV